jgi:tRNA-2-methylthio-N6-dimethylallyladenosine synthase
MEDNIPADVKQRRLAEVIALQGELSRKRMKSYVGRVHQILIEGTSKKNENQWKGRNSQNAVCVFDKLEGQKIGDIVDVFVYDNTQGTLLGDHRIISFEKAVYLLALFSFVWFPARQRRTSVNIRIL